MTIQEQLRKATVALALELPEAVYDHYSDIAFGAANRIDALEAALRQIVAGDDGDYQDNDYGRGLAHGVRGAASIARGALEASS